MQRVHELIDGFIAYSNNRGLPYDGPKSYSHLAKAISSLTNGATITKSMAEKYVVHRKAGHNEPIRKSFYKAIETRQKLLTSLIHPASSYQTVHTAPGLISVQYPLILTTALGYQMSSCIPDQSTVSNRQVEAVNVQAVNPPHQVEPANVQQPMPIFDEFGWGAAEQYSHAYSVDFIKDMVIQEKDGYVRTYRNNSTFKDTVYYQCAHCSCRAKLVNRQFYVRSHEDKCIGIESAEFHKDQCLRRAKSKISKGAKPKNAHDDAFDRAIKMNCYEGRFPRYHEVANSYRRIDRLRPRESMDELCFNGIRWKLHDGDGMMVFSTDRMLQTLAECKVVVADGTFYSSPSNFYQMFSITGLVDTPQGSEFVPLVMALLPDKTYVTYSRLLSIVKSKMTALGLKNNIGRVHCDYEKPVQQAFKEFIGEDKVYGCSFHYNQAVLKACMKAGLYTYYTSKSGPYYRIRLWLRMILAWPMLPKDDAKWLWEQYLQFPPENPDPRNLQWPTDLLLKVVVYMAQWVAINDNTLSFYGLGRTRNTNAAEALNGNLPLKSKKPALCQFLDEYQRYFTDVENRLIRLDRGAAVRRRHPMYVKLQNLRENAESRYQQKRSQLSFSDGYKLFELMLRFVREMSYLSHDIRNKSANTVKSGRIQSVKSRLQHPKRWNTKGKQLVAEAVEKDMIEAKVVDDNVVLLVLSSKVSSEDLVKHGIPEDTVEAERPTEGECDDYDDNEEADANDNNMIIGFVNRQPLPQLYTSPSKSALQSICDMFKIKMQGTVITCQSMNLTVSIPDVIGNVIGDGHCGYRALSLLLSGTEANYMTIRRELCTKIAAREVVPDKYYKKLAVVIDRMSSKAAASEGHVSSHLWMNIDDLLGFALLYKVNVVVWMSGKWNIHNTTFFDNEPFILPKLPTLLLYLNGAHFQAILSLKDKPM